MGGEICPKIELTPPTLQLVLEEYMLFIFVFFVLQWLFNLACSEFQLKKPSNYRRGELKENLKNTLLLFHCKV